jgi:N-methylhydantoinase A
VAGLSGEADLLTFDMGGTSTDVAPVRGGQVQTTTESVVAGVPVKLPMVDVHTVSAGGGSIAWVDSGGALRVGPHSAGAEPGPAAYGRGGDQPTVTDADLYLGYLADGVELGGEVRLDRAAARTALLRVGDRIGLDTHRTALGVIRVAEAEMTRALRVISVQRGLDPREFALVAFGGAGGVHACALAEELGIRRILVPRAAGVLSALGLAISDARRDEVAPFLTDLATADPAALARRYAELTRQTAAQLGPGAAPPKTTRLADLRYQGQSFELTVAVDGPGPDDERGTDAGGEPADGSRAAGDALPDLAALARRFHREHERRYGYRMDDEPVELVNLRLVATRPGSRPVLREDPARAAAADPATRRASFDREWREVAVYRRDSLGAGSTVHGPAVVEFAESTCVLRPGWIGTVDGVGTLLLTQYEGSAA